MLSHKNVASVLGALLKSDLELNKDDVHLSYLPLAHVFEKIVIFTLFYSGASIGFSCGDVLKLKDDISNLKPTVFPSVPRIYNKFYDVVKSKLKNNSKPKRMIAEYAVNSKLHYLKN